MNVPLLLLVCCPLAFFQGKTQRAHVHGTAEINIAMDGLKGEVEFEAPAEGILGIESEPKTPAQKKMVADALDTLRKRAAELVLFPAESGCKLSPKEVDVIREGAQHADVHAHYDLICTKPINAPIRFGVTRLFPRTREVKVTFVSDQSQKSARIVTDTGALKP